MMTIPDRPAVTPYEQLLPWRGDRAVAEFLADIATARSLEALASSVADGLVDVFCAREALVYFLTRDSLSLVLVASRNAEDPTPILDIDASLPAARAARSSANVFMSSATAATLGRVHATNPHAGSPLVFAAPLLASHRAVGALSAGFAGSPRPDRCAALGALRDSLATFVEPLSPRRGR